MPRQRVTFNHVMNVTSTERSGLVGVINRVFCLWVTLFFSSAVSIFGQDIRASSYELVDLGGQQFLNRLQLYVNTELDAHRDSVLVFWGVTYSWLPLTESAFLNQGDITKHTFERVFPYPGPGVYQLDVVIGSRIEGITNLSNSQEADCRLQPWFILAPMLTNSSPVVADLSAPIAGSNTGAQFSPLIEDLDGDILVYTLVPCNGEGYYIPDGTTLDPATGALTCEPPVPGLYAFCTRIEELRDGQVIATTYTDMVMEVDHVAGLSAPHSTNNAALYPAAVAQGESPSVRITKPNELVIYTVLGQMEQRVRPVPGSVLDCSRLGVGTYLYTLTDLEDGTRQSGKFQIY